VVHLLWLRKDSTLDAVIYLMVLIGLLGERAAFFWQRHQAGRNNR
jgi:DMSO/TMAO reductase YedYZ heme-binding membrane subunit